MPIPAFLLAAARVAGQAAMRSAAARTAAGAAERGAASEATGGAAKRMTKSERGVDNFNRLFKDHPANQPTPPPLPERFSWNKLADQSQQFFKQQRDEWKKNPIKSATDEMSGLARRIDSGQSIGQGVVEGMKRFDPTGLVGLASAGVDLASAGATRNVRGAQKVVQDDFVGLVGEVLPDAFQKLLRATSDLTNAIVERGRYLSRFSGELATAGGQADVRRIQSEIYEAQTVGHNYSRVTDEQSKLENKLRDAFAPAKDAIADLLATILEKLNQAIDMSFIREAIAVGSELVKFASALLSADPERIFDAIVDMPERMWKAFFDRPDQKRDFDEVIQNALADMKRMPGAAGVDPAKRKGDNKFNFPFVKGL